MGVLQQLLAEKIQFRFKGIYVEYLQRFSKKISILILTFYLVQLMKRLILRNNRITVMRKTEHIHTCNNNLT